MRELSLFLLALGGFAMLALCQFSHHKAVFRRPPSEPLARGLRLGGLLQLSIGMLVAVYLDGGYGLVLNTCLWAAAALLVLLLLAQAPRLTPVAALSLLPALLCLQFWRFNP